MHHLVLVERCVTANQYTVLRTHHLYPFTVSPDGHGLYHQDDPAHIQSARELTEWCDEEGNDVMMYV